MRVVIVPPVPALLARYSSLEDPVADLRDACHAAVATLGPSVELLADEPQARRVGEELLLGRRSTPGGADLLVMANGTGCRSEKAPGHLDPRAEGYDEWLRTLLRLGDLSGLAALDPAEGAELLTAGLRSLAVLARRLQTQGARVTAIQVDYDAVPYGVQYWVVRWLCES